MNLAATWGGASLGQLADDPDQRPVLVLQPLIVSLKLC